jgi:hypothetical protein
MIKFAMRMLTGRENADVSVGWKLQHVAGTIVDKRKIEN